MSEERKKLSNEERELSKEELVVEAKQIMEEVNGNLDVVNRPLPENLRENIDERILALGLKDEETEAEVEGERFSEEERELLRLGKLYKKKRKMRKYFVLAAAVVCALAFGVTSMGGPERVFEKLNWTLAGREQTNVDSDSDRILEASNVEEEEVYEQIEDEFGFCPVRPIYLPEEIEFLDCKIGEEIQGINLIYGKDDETSIVYFIRPNYRTGSIGADIEDQLKQKYEMQVSGVNVWIKKYNVDEDNNERWSIEFTYKDVQYFMRMVDVEEKEVEKIVKNLFFS